MLLDKQMGIVTNDLKKHPPKTVEYKYLHTALTKKQEATLFSVLVMREQQLYSRDGTFTSLDLNYCMSP